jgi:uncharacterized RDD family membrane protein YckC
MTTDLTQTRTPGLWRRFAAIFYDALLLTALLAFAAALVVVPLGKGFAINSNALSHHPLFRLYLFGLVPALFFCGFWLHGGQTLGMRAWRIKVVRTDGQPLTLWTALLRWLTAILSWTVLGGGFLWSLVDRERLTWHDRLSGTRLILLKKYNEPMI